MPTSKTRINISAPKPIHQALMDLAKRDDMPIATKTLELLKFALSQEDDYVFGDVAMLRNRQTKKWISHEDAWKTATK